MVLGLLAAPATHASSGSIAELASLPLDTLLNLSVTGASRLPQRMSETAASVSVISAEDIRALGYQSLAEVLGAMRGVAISSDRVYHYVGLRGLLAGGDYNTRVLLLIDGNRVNDALYDQAFIGDEFPLDLSEVERVEFIPGQGSAVYGANAMAGVINVVTRSAQASGGNGQVGLRLGSGGLRSGHAAWRGELGGGQLRLSASRTQAEGQALSDPQLGSTSTADGLRRSALHLRWEQGPWTLSGLYADRHKQVPISAGLVVGDPRNQYRDTQALFNLEGHQALDARTTLSGRLWAGQYQFTGDYVLNYPPVTLNRDQAEGRWWGLELRSLHQLSGRHQLTLGTELQQAPRLQQSNADLSPTPQGYLDDRRNSARAALYAEDQLRWSERWSSSLGARLEHPRNGHTRLSPRASLIYQSTGHWVAKAIAGRAYRPPNAYEAHYTVDAANGYSANPTLQAEQMHGRELALEWWPEPLTRLAGSLYRNQISGLITLDYDAALDRYSYRNVGRIVSQGFDGELETRWPDGRRLRANLSWQHTHADTALGSTRQFPQAMAKLAWVHPLRGRWQLGLEGQAMSRRDTAAGQALVHATLSTLPLPGQWGLSLNLRNVLDHRVVDPGWDTQRLPTVAQLGRQWRCSLERAF